MNSMTAALPKMAARLPLSTESSPREGATVRSSTTLTGAGKEPARRTIAKSWASFTEKLPSMMALPPWMACLMKGAE